jgi:hypothetical protein
MLKKLLGLLAIVCASIILLRLELLYFLDTEQFRYPGKLLMIKNIFPNVLGEWLYGNAILLFVHVPAHLFAPILFLFIGYLIASLKLTSSRALVLLMPVPAILLVPYHLVVDLSSLNAIPPRFVLPLTFLTLMGVFSWPLWCLGGYLTRQRVRSYSFFGLSTRMTNRNNSK